MFTHSTSKRRRALFGAIPTAALAAATLVPGTTSHAAPVQDPEPAEVSASAVSSKANTGWAYAHARWAYTSLYSTGKIKIYVNDQSCRDGYDTFAFVQIQQIPGGSVVTDDGRAKDYNSDCVGKGRATTFSGKSSNRPVYRMRVVVCKNDTWGTGDTCKLGNWKKNPYYA